MKIDVRRVVAVVAGVTVFCAVAYAQDKSKTQVVAVRVDGKKVGYGFVIDGNTFVPLRSVVAAMKCDVQFDSATQEVLITSPVQPTSDIPVQSTYRFAGSNSRKTEPFRITSKRWKITWKHSPPDGETSFFSVTLYRVSDNRMVEMVGSTTKAGGETSYQYSPGEYYLSIGASEEYEIVIEQ